MFPCPSVALFSLIYKFLPSQLIVAVFILALVLVMSTVDTLLNAIVATFALDSQQIFKKVKSESLLPFARMMMVVLMIPAIFIAARGYSVLYLFFVADLVCAGVVFPIFFGLFNTHLSERTALVASIFGVASGIPFFTANKLLLAFALPVIVSAVICIMSTLTAKKSNDLNKAKF